MTEAEKAVLDLALEARDSQIEERYSAFWDAVEWLRFERRWPDVAHLHEQIAAPISLLSQAIRHSKDYRD